MDRGSGEAALVTDVGFRADHGVGRAAAQSEIVPVDAALGRAGHFAFIQLLREATGTSGGKFQTAEQVGIQLKILRVLAPELKPSEQGNIANSRFRPLVGRKAFGALKGAMDELNIELNGDPVIEAIAHERLGDGTVQVLTRRIGDLAAIDLQSAEVSELFRKARSESRPSFTPSSGGRVNRADIAPGGVGA